MKVLTVATENSGYYEVLVESCQRYGLDLHTLGFGEKWRGFTWKFFLVRQFLDRLDSREVVLFADGFDTCALADESVITTRFRSFNKDIVISSETRLNLHSQWAYKQVFGVPCNGENINSGLYIGYAGALRGMFQRLCTHFDCNNLKLDDQEQMMYLCRNDNEFFSQHVAVDSRSLLFLTIVPKNIAVPTVDYTDHRLFELQDHQIVVTETQTSPVFIHGPCFANLDAVLKVYRFTLPSSRWKRGLLYYPKAVQTYAVYFRNYLLFIVCVCCLCVCLYYYSTLPQYHSGKPSSSRSTSSRLNGLMR